MDIVDAVLDDGAIPTIPKVRCDHTVGLSKNTTPEYGLLLRSASLKTVDYALVPAYLTAWAVLFCDAQQWCDTFLKPLILQCLDRVPANRPSFTDIILRLRQFSNLEDSHYFFQFDIPRIR